MSKKPEENIDQKLDKFVKEGRVEDATQCLFESILRCLGEGDFKAAEALRERLFDFDPIPMDKIIESAELIERQKKDAIDRNYLKIWDKLNDTLTDEEANALYYSMKNETYGPDQVLIQKGKQNSRLYFINKGELKMIYEQGEKEFFLKSLKPGDIAGEDTFFSISDCTTTIITLTDIEATFLDRDTLSELKDEFPGIESKLFNYCRKFETTQDLLEKKNLDRRDQKRVSVSQRINLQPVNRSGKSEGNSFKGDLADISIGGASIFVYRSNKEMARRLLGRRLNMQFAYSLKASVLEFNHNGLVIAVSDRLFNDYSLHVKFDELLSETIIEDIDSYLSINNDVDETDFLFDSE